MALNGENTWKRACFCAFMLIVNMKAQKHACFRVNFPFSAYLYMIMVKGSLLSV